jgi:hypothetical protein
MRAVGFVVILNPCVRVVKVVERCALIQETVALLFWFRRHSSAGRDGKEEKRRKRKRSDKGFRRRDRRIRLRRGRPAVDYEYLTSTRRAHARRRIGDGE